MALGLRTACWLLLAVSTVYSTGIAVGSETSERLYSKGLVELHAGRYADAMALFERAVAADPNDVEAIYSRGVARVRVGDLEGAESDLRRALARQPGIGQGSLELGVVLVKRERYEDALEWLERASSDPGTYAEASFFRGIAELRLDRTREAALSFERAGRDTALNTSARYYSGVAAYRLGDLQAAERHFSYVVAQSADSAIGREAKEFLSSLAAGYYSPWHLYGEVGFQYDSNLSLLPSDDSVQEVLGVTNLADGRAILTVGGNYTPWRNETTEVRVGYEFYQSAHFQEQAFNLQDHRPSIDIQHDAGPVMLGLRTRYDFYLRESSSFLQSLHSTPWLIIPEGEFGRTEMYYRMRWNGFYPEAFENLRDAWNHSVGGRQIFYLGKPQQFVYLGYRYDREDPVHRAGAPFGYDGHQVDVGGGWALTDQLGLELDYAYRNEAYDGARDDNEHRLIFAVEKFFSHSFSVVAAYYGAFNDSNDPRFTYDRNIGSLTFRARY